MPSVINTNLASMFAQKSLSGAQNNLATAVQRLSSGLRINSSKDDAAGLSVAQNMQSQINAVNMAARNINDATNMLTTADGSLSTIQDMMLRMKALVVEGRNDSLSNSQRKNIYTELAQLDIEVNAVAARTTFNGNSILSNGAAQTITGSGTVGATAAAAASVASLTFSGTTAATYTLASVSASQLSMTNGTTTQTVTTTSTAGPGYTSQEFSQFGITIGLLATAASTQASFGASLNGKVITVANAAAVSLAFQSGAANSDSFSFQTLNVQTDSNGADATYTALRTRLSSLATANTSALYSSGFGSMAGEIDTAIDQMNNQRATLGAQMNRLGQVSNMLLTQSTNISASRSAIIDTDFASETASLTKGQIMQQAATAMLAQANQMPNVILSLLK